LFFAVESPAAKAGTGGVGPLHHNGAGDCPPNPWFFRFGPKI